MKNYNRRDFLKLTGASALALALAACGGGGGGSVRPAEKKEQALYNAINVYRSKNEQQPLVYNEKFEALMKQYASCYEKQQVTSANFNEWYTDPTVNPDAEKVAAEINRVQQELAEEGFTGYTQFYGLADDSDDKMALNALYPKTEEELEKQMKDFAAKFGDMRYIGIALATVKGETYWIAALLPKKKTDV